MSRRSTRAVLRQIGLAFTVLFLSTAIRTNHGFGAPAPAQPPSAAHQKALDQYMHAPVPFEPNLGQTDPAVKFVARGNRYTVFFTETGVVLRLADADAAGVDNVLEMKLVGARKAKIAGQEPLLSRSRYFHGNAPEKWLGDVPHYAKVNYAAVYPHTDVIFYGRQGELEYDVVLGPGADPSGVVLEFTGARQLRVDDQGDLVLSLSEGREIVQRRPKVYQQAGARKTEISGRYRLLAANRVRFEVGGYDRRKPLVIDPVLSYSSYLGGSGSNNDQASAIALDAAGNVYVAGFTNSMSFPIGANPPLQPVYGGGTDAFVAKLSTDGSTLIYSTYLGGSSNDQAKGIAVDPSGSAYVVGTTSSTNFPATPGAFQTSLNGSSTFIAKLDPTGSKLVYATYLGSGTGSGIAVDALAMPM